MAIRMTAKDLLANLLGSDKLKEGTTITQLDLRRFQNNIQNLVPGHIWYETTKEDIAKATDAFSSCCKLMDTGSIKFLNKDNRPNRYNYNVLLPSIVASILPSYADYFIETNYD